MKDIYIHTHIHIQFDGQTYNFIFSRLPPRDDMLFIE